MQRCFLFLLSIVPLCVNATPHIKSVPLLAHTTLALNIDQGGGGTRFSFPFVLDEADDNVPFTLVMTNKAFVDSYSANKLPGRNSFVVTIAPQGSAGATGQQRATLFITVGGYEITVELHATSDVSSVYSDIVFELSDDARQSLIQQAVRLKTDALEKQYQERHRALAIEADNLALSKLGTIALSDPKTFRIKEESKTTLPVGEVLLYVDKAISYGTYTIIKFEVDNRSYSAPISVQGAKLFAINRNKDATSTTPIDGGVSLPPIIPPRSDGIGAITVMTASMPKEIRSLQLQLATDQGNLKLEW